jgi:hypothetical protein
MLFQSANGKKKSKELPIPLCVFNRHSPYRQFVRWDGLNFVGHCKHCGEPIRRKEHKVWLKEWREDSPLLKPTRAA